MKNLSTLFLCVFLTACSSLKKTVLYSSLAGGMTGAATGILVSPNKQSHKGNALIFGLAGAGLGALASYILYQDDPRNYRLSSMLTGTDKREGPRKLEIALGAIKIDAKLDKKEAYRIPVKKLPEKLKGKVGRPYLIKYQSKERVMRKGEKTYYLPSFDIYEYSYGLRAFGITGDSDARK